jgi:hypothetical protein
MSITLECVLHSKASRAVPVRNSKINCTWVERGAEVEVVAVQGIGRILHLPVAPEGAVAIIGCCTLPRIKTDTLCSHFGIRPEGSFVISRTLYFGLASPLGKGSHIDYESQHTIDSKATHDRDGGNP